MAIGVFDSGVGGLTVHRELTRRFPDRDFVYLADQANAPYGGRAGDEIVDLTQAGCERLFEAGANLIVLACNTASAIALRRLQRLNILTNSLAVAMELGDFPTFRVILLGGRINTQYAFTSGSDALAQLAQYKADKAILSVDGIDSAGITTYHAEEAEINRAMISRSRQTIIVADSSKLGRESFNNICALQAIGCLVTNRDADPDTLRTVRASGVEVVTA